MGLTAGVFVELVEESGPLWQESHQARLAARPRKRAVGAGAKHRLGFVDGLLAMLVHLRHGVTHDVLACWFGVDRSTITRAVGEVRLLLAERGFTVSPPRGLRSLADVVDYLGASGTTGIVDGTEIRVRQSAVRRKDRDKFISGTNKQNAVKPWWSRTAKAACCGSPARPASSADIIHAPPVEAGQALGRRARGGDLRRCRLPGYGRADRRPGGDTTASRAQEERPGLVRGDARATGKTQSSRRFQVEHGITHLKN
ncbi:helix-turn-helix domain-containing protein [Streptomyces sp. SudanB66_2053]|uniref:helix-turn-helix domain-containing protein n=1 Tax=Streptomyces sp. SudanB66_2053 TaxID=3035277 RepID=UPI003F560C79